jgi:hypothetical protein
MTHPQTIEIIALVTGIIVIGIETLIIFLLERHIRALNKHWEKNERLMVKFEKRIAEHIDHLHEHTHDIDERLAQICDGKVKIK